MSIKLSEARSIIRKAKRRVPEGESVSHLNLTAMMDMMTILLVFMIMNAAYESSPLTVTAKLPGSITSTVKEEKAVEVVIDEKAILVDGHKVVNVVSGDVEAKYKTQGSGFGLEIAPLKKVLDIKHDIVEKEFAKKREKPIYEITLIVDQSIPFRLLYSVMYTAGNSAGQLVQPGDPNAEGFQKFRLLVVKKNF